MNTLANRTQVCMLSARREAAMSPRAPPLAILPTVVADAPSAHSTSGANVSGTVMALAGLAATAGVIHLVATVQHVTENQLLGVFFAVIGAAQFFVGWRIYRDKADQRLLILAAAGSVVVALLWVFSRTTGLPVGPELGIRKVGVADSIATLQEFAFTALAVVILRRSENFPRGQLARLDSAFAMRLTSAALSSSLFIAALGGHQH